MLIRRAAIAALLVPLFAIVAQEKKDPPKADDVDPKRKEAFEAMVKEYASVQKAANIEVRQAKTDEQRKAAEAKRPQEKDFLPKILPLLKANATDDIAVECCLFAVFGLDSKNADVFKVLEGLAVGPKIESFVEICMGQQVSHAKPILEKVAKDNPDKKFQGMALMGIAAILAADEDPKSGKEAEAIYERIEKEYAKIRTEEGSLGDMAKQQLRETRELGIGKPAPKAESKNLKGDKESLESYKGKVVVLDIWATWCGPCRQMIPHQREMAERHKSNAFALISVSADDDQKTLEEFLAKEKMPWNHWFQGPEGSVLKTFNVRFFPTVYVIDSAGVIRAKNIRGSELDKVVDKLVAEAKKK